MKLLSFLLLIQSFALVSLAHADIAGKFEAVYIDPSNDLAWSKALLGTYTNGCNTVATDYDPSKCTYDNVTGGGRQVWVDDSDAAKACRNIGASLPTLEEYESLIKSVGTLNGGHNYYIDDEIFSPRLTPRGKADMQAIFGDMNNCFWSSTVALYRPYTNDSAFLFYGGDGTIDVGGAIGFTDRNHKCAVRCVSAH